MGVKRIEISSTLHSRDNPSSGNINYYKIRVRISKLIHRELVCIFHGSSNIDRISKGVLQGSVFVFFSKQMIYQTN